MNKSYRKMERKATGKIREISTEEERKVQIPLPILEVVAGAYDEVERLIGKLGIMVMESIMLEESERIAGKFSERNPDRKAYHWGAQNGYVYFGGKKVEVIRHRVREKNGGEVELKSYKAFQNPDRIRESVAKKMMINVSTRNYEKAVNDFMEGYGVDKSSVSRHFVEATKTKLKEFLERDLTETKPAAIFIDGIDFSGHLLVVALGMDEQGHKKILGFREGASENKVVCVELLQDMIRRGLDAQGNYLFVLDGSKGLRSAVTMVFGDHAHVQRCHKHKRRNVAGHLDKEHQDSIDARICKALNEDDYEKAKKSLNTTIAYLDRINPSAASSLREGMEELLTVHKLRIPQTLRKTLCTTNPIESCFSVTRHITDRVKNWRKGDMVQRWAASALIEAEKKFRRVKGFKDIPLLIKSLSENSFDSKEVAA